MVFCVYYVHACTTDEIMMTENHAYVEELLKIEGHVINTPCLKGQRLLHVVITSQPHQHVPL